MQFFCSDYREVIRYERIEPDDDDERGDAVPTFTRCSEPIATGWDPISITRTASDSGISQSESRWTVIVSFSHPFKVGDRLGPIGSSAPTHEVVSISDYPTSQNMEVRSL